MDCLVSFVLKKEISSVDESEKLNQIWDFRGQYFSISYHFANGNIFITLEDCHNMRAAIFHVKLN